MVPKLHSQVHSLVQRVQVLEIENAEKSAQLQKQDQIVKGLILEVAQLRKFFSTPAKFGGMHVQKSPLDVPEAPKSDPRSLVLTDPPVRFH